jgi:hypothetical protein
VKIVVYNDAGDPWTLEVAPATPVQAARVRAWATCKGYPHAEKPPTAPPAPEPNPPPPAPEPSELD